MITVNLFDCEVKAAGTLGLKREALRAARGKAVDFSKLDAGGSNDWRNQVGAICEYALARHYGKDVLQDWCEHKSFILEHWKIKADVGVNLHVRGTSNPRGRLICHPYDPDDGVFILARIAGNLVTFVGWRYGRVVKRPPHWVNYGRGFSKRPAFVLPNEDLIPMDLIPNEAIR